VSTGDGSVARTRRRQIADFEWHWDGAFILTGYEGGKFRTTYAPNGEVLIGETITDLRDEARNYYARMHAHSSST
jgi:hypothetical protein